MNKYRYRGIYSYGLQCVDIDEVLVDRCSIKHTKCCFFKNLEYFTDVCLDDGINRKCIIEIVGIKN